MAKWNPRKAAIEATKKARFERMRAAQQIVATGVCPTCGTKLYRNLSLSGWRQCGHVGAVGFQKEPGPHCDFQIFYDVTPAEHAAILAAEAESKSSQIPTGEYDHD